MRSLCFLVWSAMVLACGVAQAQTQKDGSSFEIRPDYSHKDIFEVYDGLHKAGAPQFITTDLALHTGHLLFDYSLRAIEIDRLQALAEKLTDEMTDAFSTRAGSQDLFPDERLSLLAYFSVARKILEPDWIVPAAVASQVSKDLVFMKEHKGFAVSLALDNAEDFSQYIPRGHYTRNEEFERYFKAMMWYGRRMFRVDEIRPKNLPILDPWSEGHRLAESRQMLLITAALYRRTVDGRPAIETWRSLYTPTTFFAGRTEDLNPLEVRALMDQVWGGLPEAGALQDETKVRSFLKLAQEFTKPRIDSSGAGRKGFCFMAQRFTPDSYITQCLVTDADIPFGEGVPAHPLAYTGDRKPRPFTWGVNHYLSPSERRFLPRGLDVLAAFGCDEATAILKEEGDAEYDGYGRMMEYLRQDVGRLMRERQQENLYYGWLYALQPMFRPTESAKVPECFRSKGWMRKELGTSLASWTELRHDTILYVKQSYTPAPRAPQARPEFVPGYVEPQPEVFRRIGRMVEKMRTDLAALGVMPAGLEENYRTFSSVCEQLAGIADRELAGGELTQADCEWIGTAAGRLQSSTLLPPDLWKKITDGTDSQQALVADVHTDTNSRIVLEEGVGTPFLIEVRMPFAGQITTFEGAVFSHYEFKHPMADRLTDEAWQKLISDPGQRPAVPDWFPAVCGEKQYR